MFNLEGWKSPGRSATELTHSQIYGIISYLSDKKKIGSDVWGPPLQLKIGKTINVNTDNTLRHIIGYMKSIGIIYDDALKSGKVPDPNYCVSDSGEVLYSLIKLEKIAIESKDNILLDQITNMYKQFYANAFIYWYVRNSKVHVARSVLKTIKQFEYLDKIEWFILNTFVSETDNMNQEKLVEKYITEYRSGELTLTSKNIVKQETSFTYWTQLLSFAGLIKKINNKLYIGTQFPELIEAILADDFLTNLNIKDRYKIKL